MSTEAGAGVDRVSPLTSKSFIPPIQSLIFIFSTHQILLITLIHMLIIWLILISSLVSAKSPSYDVKEENLREDIRFLTSTFEPRHYLNKGGTKQAADYIKKVFNENSYRVEVQKYSTHDEHDFENIIATFGPTSGKRIVIGAHYDVCDLKPGADDNASGVAAILELSRIFKFLNLKMRVDLVAYGTEEPPYFGTKDMGSYHHATILRKDNVDIELMISLDGIGYFSSNPNSQTIPFPLSLFYPDTANFIAIVGNLQDIDKSKRFQELMIKNANGLKVERLNGPEFIPHLGLSDHRNFWAQGYPAILITDTAFLRNPNYHTDNDKIETLDFAAMTEVVRALWYTIENLTNI